MAADGRVALRAALALFVAFFANVIAGAAGAGPVIGDIAEMLTLFAASALFVAGVLGREAAAARRVHESNDREETS